VDSIFGFKYSKNDNVSQFNYIAFARRAAMENGQDGVNGTSLLKDHSARR
jgi:hypothetical protein